MSDPVRIGIVGAGRLVELGYLPAARLLDDVRVVAVADPDAERRETLAPQGVLTFTADEDLLDAGNVEALVVASPPAAHEEAARLAAAARLPALVEKPPAPDLAGARRIAELDPSPWIGFNRRFSLGSGLAGTLPAGGTIEVGIHYRRFTWAPVTVRDPALIDLAPHLVDLALRAGVGEPRAVVARSRRSERISIRLRGSAGSALLRCACDRPHREWAVVRDASGAVTTRRRLGGLARGVAARARRGTHPLVASLAAQLAEFAAAARGTPAPTLATAADGVAAMGVLAAAAASLAHGGEEVAVDAAVPA